MSVYVRVGAMPAGSEHLCGARLDMDGHAMILLNEQCDEAKRDAMLDELYPHWTKAS